MDIPHSFYDDKGIFHCNMIVLLLDRAELSQSVYTEGKFMYCEFDTCQKPPQLTAMSPVVTFSVRLVNYCYRDLLLDFQK